MNKNIVTICVTVLIIFSVIFYWSYYRPASIRAECQKEYDQHLITLHKINQRYAISDNAPNLMRSKHEKYGHFDPATLRTQYRFPEEVLSGMIEEEKGWLEPLGPYIKETAMYEQAAKTSFDSCLNKHGLNPGSK